MKKTKLQMLNELKQVLTYEEEGNHFDLNEIVQYPPLDAFNVDDNGIAMFDDVKYLLLDEEEKELHSECAYASHKEEFNENIGEDWFYWLNIEFLEEWRNEWECYHSNPLTKEAIQEFHSLIDKEIAKVEKGIEDTPKTFGKSLEEYTTEELILQIMKNEDMLVNETYKDLEDKIDNINDYFWRKAHITDMEEEEGN